MLVGAWSVGRFRGSSLTLRAWVAQDIADPLPSDEGQAFLQLFEDPSSTMSDAAYAAEASSFEASYC